MYEINYVCSLGPRCHTAQLLKRNNLKLASYPFDWIFANLEVVTHCIEKNFESLLDKKYYTINDVASKSQQHSLYFSNENEHIFNHHNPLKVDDHNYFVRCIQRFNNLLEKKELKMFVLNFLNYYPIDEVLKKDIIELNNLLKSVTQNYGILCIVHYVDLKCSHKFMFHENIHFLEITTPSISNGLEFLRKEDNDYLDNIITSTYNFKLNEIEKIPNVYGEEVEEQVEKEKEESESESESESETETESESESETESEEEEIILEIVDENVKEEVDEQEREEEEIILEIVDENVKEEEEVDEQEREEEEIIVEIVDENVKEEVDEQEREEEEIIVEIVDENVKEEEEVDEQIVKDAVEVKVELEIENMEDHEEITVVKHEDYSNKKWKMDLVTNKWYLSTDE